MTKQIAYGIDLAGYSTGKSGFATASRDVSGSIQVTVSSSHAFSRSISGHKKLGDASKAEVALLKKCLLSGRTLIDMPLDLQSLGEPWEAEYVWQLTKRPVDYAFAALPPLADKIGSPVARIRNVLRTVKRDSDSLLEYGENLFETYPAGSLELLGLPRTGYKGQRITFLDGKWVGETLAVIANGLNLVAEDEVSLDDDDVDAVICALTGVLSDVLEGPRLREEITNRLSQRLPSSAESIDMSPPDGYRLLNALESTPILVRTSADGS